jgi:hypothetical protein
MKTLGRKIKSMLLGVVVAATVVATPTAARADFSSCGAGSFCVFADANGEGDLSTFTLNTIPQRSLGPRGFNDRTSSYRNNTSYSICLYKNDNYDSLFWTAYPGQSYSWNRLADFPMNDILSSFRYC